MSSVGYQNNLIDVNFHLQKSLDIFEKKLLWLRIFLNFSVKLSKKNLKKNEKIMEHANTIWFMSSFVKVIHSFINHPEIWWQHFQEFCILSTSFVLWVVTRLTNFVIILDGRINHFKKMTTAVSVSPDYWTFGSTRSKYELVKSKKNIDKKSVVVFLQLLLY